MVTTFTLILDMFSRFWAALQHGNVLPLGNWNYIFLFIFVIIQGPLVKLLSGAVVSTTYLNLITVILVSITASMTADTAWYCVGRLGKFHRYFRRNSDRRKKMVDALLLGMEKHYFKVLLLGKLSLGLAIPSILAAGISKISWRKWLPAVLLGEIIYTTILVGIGFFAAESINHANHTIKLIGMVFTAVFIMTLVLYLPNTIRKILLDEQTNLNLTYDHK